MDDFPEKKTTPDEEEPSEIVIATPVDVPDELSIDVQTEIPLATPDIYSAPRCFDVSTIFTITAAYAILFGVLRGIGAEPLWVSLIAGFITIVAVAQALVFRGNSPREASFLVGGGACAIGAVVFSGFFGIGPFIGGLICLATPGFVLGMIFGYLAGVLVGGVFLVADQVRRRISRHHSS